MSVLQCTIKQVENKTAKSGKAYQRVLTLDATGREEWFANFSPHHFIEGQTGAAAIKEGKYHEKYGQSYFIDDWIPGDAPQPTQEPPRSPQNAPETGAKDDQDVWRKKDLNIATQAFFKVMYQGRPGDQVVGSQDVLKNAFALACQLEKRVNAYVAGADLDGVRESLQDQVEAAVNEDLSHQADTDTGNPGEPEHPAFDDDIPF